jgi:hypothetical protein
MSARSRSRGEKPRASEGRVARRRLGRIAALGIIVLAVATAVLLPRARRPASIRSAGDTSDFALMDSLKAADARRDWVSALDWAERLGRTRPLDHTVLVARGTAWSNYAVDARPGRLRARPSLRTSLERSACMRRAIGLLDSSGLTAQNTDQWINSGSRLANLYESLGLPGDALLACETMKQRLPGVLGPAMRAYWLRALFYDPVHPDTSEYHERMKRQGLR